MKVVIAHNFYRSSTPSGENIVVAREIDLLKQFGINCRVFSKNNDELDQASFIKKLQVAWQMAGSKAHKNRLKNELSKLGEPGILHAHNLMPMFGYDLLQAAKELGYQTIQSLHNYQLIASAQGFYSEAGLKKPQNQMEAKELKKLNTQSRGFLDFFYQRAYLNFWQEQKLQFIDKFICLTEFQKQLMLKAGLPAHKLFVKPNFVPDSKAYQAKTEAGDYAIFVGRLSEEKGILALTQAWQKLSIPLYVVGSGPLASQMPKASHIHYLGVKTQEELMPLIAKARFLVMNSVWYEPFGLVAVEALSCGLPCLLPNIAALPEFISDNNTGYLFEPENMKDMAEKAMKLWSAAPAMAQKCREEYLNRYTPQANFAKLMQIYQA